MFSFLTIFAQSTSCKPSGSGLLGFPHWYKYLQGVKVTVDNNTSCVPQALAINDIWLIVAAIIDILLRVAALAAVFVIVWGGIQYILSQGEPERIKKAQATVFDALIGLVIAVAATAAVTYFAGRFN